MKRYEVTPGTHATSIALLVLGGIMIGMGITLPAAVAVVMGTAFVLLGVVVVIGTHEVETDPQPQS